MVSSDRQFKELSTDAKIISIPIRKVIQIQVEGTLRRLKKMILRKRALKVSQVSKHINIINIHCRKLKFGMLIEHSVWHTVVKVHKNNYASFCYRNFGNTIVKTMAEIILKCDCRHTKLMCFIGIAMILIYVITSIHS